MGIQRAGQGALEQAAACFREALDLRTDFEPARGALAQTLVALGNSCRQRGRVPAAQACYRRATEIAPLQAGPWNNLGAMLLEMGDEKGAADRFRRAIELDPGFSEAHLNLSLALDRLGEPGAAAEALERLTTAAPDCGQGWRHLGLKRFHQGDLSGAAEALWKALSMDADMDDIDRILLVLLQAGIFFGRCRPAAAETWVARLRDLDPDSPQPEMLDLGICNLIPETAAAAWQTAAERLEASATAVTMAAGNRSSKAAPVPDPPRTAVLLNFGRSGTGFLHSLVDHHPQVTTLPGIYLKDFFSRGVWEAVADPDARVMAEHFCSLYEVLFDARLPQNVPGSHYPAHFPIGVSEGFTRMGPDGTEALGLDRDRFRGHLTTLLEQEKVVDSGRFFTRVHAAFERTLGRPPSPGLLFYHIHNPNPFTFTHFLRRFPGCRILTIVRDPLQSLESWISKSMDEPGAYPQIVNKVVRMLYGLDRIEFSRFPSAGVRLEDLKRHPDATLMRLCRFLGIDMAPSLKHSTMQGLRWWGDPGSIRLENHDPFGRLADDPTDRTVGAILSDRDQWVLATLFYPFSRRFGYPADPDPTPWARDLSKIRPLLDRPFDFERRYARAFPRDLVPLERNHFCGYLRRLSILRWETLSDAGTYPGLLAPI